ncbi:hypothetical protein [Microbulbifer sp. TYP-18]|uniref:hypothetical protein n=1 Tax=Microbulbifer sp. TYP-18 TaxID=3230024 RepID=UPI0034C5D3BE
MRFSNLVRRVALAFIREKQLPESVWNGETISFHFTSLFWAALLFSASIVFSPLLWLVFQPVIYLMAQYISDPVERWLWLFLVVLFMLIVNLLDGFIQKADRSLKISYGDLGLGEKIIYCLVSMVAFRWMFSPVFRLMMNRLFTALLCAWYVIFNAFLAGMF